MSGLEVSAEVYPVVTRQMLHNYANASGDQNPIHLDDAVAKQFGLPGIIAHGMLTAAWIADRAQRWVKERSGKEAAWVSVQNRFRTMTLLGDTVSIGGTAQETSEGGVTRWQLELAAKNGRGEVTTTGSLILETQ